MTIRGFHLSLAGHGARRALACALVLSAAPLVIALVAPEPVEAAFPGANGKIAFQRFGQKSGYEIFVMNPDGSGVARLTDDRYLAGDPAWSPDGSKIAYVSTRAGSNEVYVMNADGTGDTRLTNTKADESAPAWSPDGTKIAVTSDDGNGVSFHDRYQVAVMNADGSGKTNLRPGILPAWSPDGTKISFVGNVHRAFDPDIGVMNADGSALVLLEQPSTQLDPTWSPDGRIAYVSTTPAELAPGTGASMSMYTVNPDGSSRTFVTILDGALSGMLSYSPDGAKIVFAGRISGADIRMMNPDGSGQTNLTHNGLYEIAPDWQTLPLPSPSPSPSQSESPAPSATPSPSPSPTEPPGGGFDPEIGSLVGIAVDPASGNLFVHPQFTDSIAEFTPSGTEVAPRIPLPGAPSDAMDLDFVSEAVNVGGSSIPANSLLVVNGDMQPEPERLFGIDPATGAVLGGRDLPTGSETVGGTYHPGRDSFFYVDYVRDEIVEVDPATGTKLGSFRVAPTGSPPFDVYYGDVDLSAATGNLFVVGSSQTTIRELSARGSFVRDVDVGPLGVESMAGIALDDERGAAWVSSLNGAVYRVDGVLAVGGSDTDPPETIILLGPPNRSLTPDHSPSFLFAADEEATFQCKLDSASFKPCTAPKGYKTLARGKHTFKVRAVDKAGNTDGTPAQTTWMIE